MKSAFNSPTFICLLICCGSVAAQVATPTGTKRPASKDITVEKIKLGEDEPGCKDSALLARIPGCSIIQCDSKEADGMEIQVGALPDGTIQKEAMDGSAEVLYYLCPARIPLATIVKLLDASLAKSGYKTVFYGRDGDDFPLVTGLKDNQWVQISTYMYDDNAAYIQTALKVPLETQANTDAMADEMAKTGRVVLHGLSFNAEQELMAAESEKMLTEIDAFLVRQPDMRIRIEGYTDIAESKAGNTTASQKQASAVAMWLLEHGIDKSRISIQGLGDSKPIVEGSTPEAKEKNRRIELVRI